jgi:hypothetical protein
MKIQCYLNKVIIKFPFVVILFAIVSLLLVNNAYAHSIPLNKIAVKACENKARSATCEYEGGHHDLYIGTCQHMSSDLICVRNQPIKKIEVLK